MKSSPQARAFVEKRRVFDLPLFELLDFGPESRINKIIVLLNGGVWVRVVSGWLVPQTNFNVIH